MTRLFTVRFVSSLAVSLALFAGCSNGSSPSDSGSAGNSGTGGGSATGGTSHGASGEAGATSANGGSAAGGSSATGGGAGEAGSTDASGGSAAGGTGGNETGGTGGTGGDVTGGTGGDVTGGTGGGGTGGDLNGGTGGSGGTGGTKGGTPSPNVGCKGSVASDSGSHELTSCGFSVSKIPGSGQTQFTLGLQGNDESKNGLTVTLQFTDAPTATTYTFASTDYAQFNSLWDEDGGKTVYTATAYDGIVGVGSITVEFDTIDGPFTLGGTTFYTVSGSISANLVNPPSGMADVEITF